MTSTAYSPMTAGAARLVASLGEPRSALRVGRQAVFDGPSRAEPALIELGYDGTLIEHSIEHLRPIHAWSVDDGAARAHQWTIVSVRPARVLEAHPLEAESGAYRYRLFDLDARALIADLGVVESAGSRRQNNVVVAVDGSAFIVRTADDEATLYSRDGVELERSSRLMHTLRAGAFASSDRLWSLDSSTRITERERRSGAVRTLALPAETQRARCVPLVSSGVALIELYDGAEGPPRVLCVDPTQWAVRWSSRSHFVYGIDVVSDERHVVLVPDMKRCAVHDLRTGALVALGEENSHWSTVGAHRGELLTRREQLVRQRVDHGALVDAAVGERSAIRSVWVSSDGQSAVVNDSNGLTRWYDVTRGALSAETNARQVIGEAFGGRAVVLARDEGADSVACTWNASGEHHSYSLAPATSARKLIASSDGRYVLAQQSAPPHTLLLSRLAGDAPARVISEVPAFASAAFDEDAQRLYFHGANGSWSADLRERGLLVALPEPSQQARELAMWTVCNATLVVYELSAGSVRLWRWRSDEWSSVHVSRPPRAPLVANDRRATPYIAKSAERLALVTWDGARVSVHDAQGAELAAIEFALGAERATTCALSSDGAWLAVGTASGVTHVFALR